MTTETIHPARPLVIVEDLSQFADETGQLIWTTELAESLMGYSDFDQKQPLHTALMFASSDIQHVNLDETWRQYAYDHMMPIVLSSPLTRSGTHYGPSLRSGNVGEIEFIRPSFFEQYGHKGVNGWTRLLRSTLRLRHRMHLTRGKTLKQWFADGEIFFPADKDNPYTEAVFLTQKGGELHVERIPVQAKELPAVEYVSYRKGQLLKVLESIRHDDAASALEADLAATAGVTERRTNHFLYVIRDKGLITRVQQMFGCADCDVFKTLVVMFSDHKVKLGHDARYESW